MFNLKVVDDAKLVKPILNNTPILSGVMNDTIKVIDEFAVLKDKYDKATDSENFNRETLELFLKYKIVS